MRLPKARSWPHWGTPKEIVDRLTTFGAIVLDPCWNAQSLVCPIWAYTGTQVVHQGTVVEGSGDGLALSWAWEGQPDGFVYVNPPYGPGDMRRWSEKIAAEATMGVEIVVLVAKRSSAKWYQTLMQASPSVVLDIGPKRIQFTNPPPPLCKYCAEDDSHGSHSLRDFPPTNGQHPFCPRPVKDNSSVESVMFYYGDRQERFCQVFGDRGYAMRPVGGAK